MEGQEIGRSSEFTVGGCMPDMSLHKIACNILFRHKGGQEANLKFGPNERSRYFYQSV